MRPLFLEWSQLLPECNGFLRNVEAVRRPRPPPPLPPPPNCHLSTANLFDTYVLLAQNLEELAKWEGEVVAERAAATS